MPKQNVALAVRRLLDDADTENIPAKTDPIEAELDPCSITVTLTKEEATALVNLAKSPPAPSGDPDDDLDRVPPEDDEPLSDELASAVEALEVALGQCNKGDDDELQPAPPAPAE